MSGLVRTCVEIPVILWQQVHVMEDEAVPVEVLEGFPEPHIHQHGSVELVPSCLVDDVQAVVELLPCQEWVDVTQECS